MNNFSLNRKRTTRRRRKKRGKTNFQNKNNTTTIQLNQMRPILTRDQCILTYVTDKLNFKPLYALIIQHELGRKGLPFPFPPIEITLDSKSKALWNSRQTIHVHMKIDNHWRVVSNYITMIENIQSLAITLQSNILCFILQLEYQSIVRLIKEFADWRYDDGCNLKGPVSSKCTGGHSHGYDSLSRVFLMEAMLYDVLSYRYQMKMKREFDIKTVREIRDHKTGHIISTVCKDEKTNMLMRHKLLVHCFKPIHRWEIRLCLLELRNISHRFNFITELMKTKNNEGQNLRQGIINVIRSIELRAYKIIRASLDHPVLHERSSSKAGGIGSKDFNGSIVCTPANNYGFSLISSSGSWFDTMLWRVSRTSTKLLHLMRWLDRICPLSVRSHSESSSGLQNYGCRNFYEVCKVLLPQSSKQASDKSFQLRMRRYVKNFNSRVREQAILLLNSKQIQSQLTAWIWCTLAGVDADIKRGEVAMNSISEKDYTIWKISKEVITRAVNSWSQLYLRIAPPAYWLNSLMSQSIPDFINAFAINVFEIATKRDNRNSAGFIPTFFVRLDSVSSVRYIIEHDLNQCKLPFIMKVGADYACVWNDYDPNTGIGSCTTIECKTMSEAIICWALYIQKTLKWCVQDLNLESIYKPILNDWCGINNF